MENEINKFILYTTPSGKVRVDVLLENETIWLTQKAMSELFGCTNDNISLHLKTFLAIGNWKQVQLPRDPWQLQQMAKSIKPIITT